MKWYFKILLALNVLYCLFGAVTKAVPAWSMFESAQKIDFIFANKLQSEVDLRKFVPKDVYFIRLDSVLDVAQFVCKKFPEQGPYTFQLKGQEQKITFSPPNCVLKND